MDFWLETLIPNNVKRSLVRHRLLAGLLASNFAGSLSALRKSIDCLFGKYHDSI